MSARCHAEATTTASHTQGLGSPPLAAAKSGATSTMMPCQLLARKLNVYAKKTYERPATRARPASQSIRATSRHDKGAGAPTSVLKPGSVRICHCVDCSDVLKGSFIHVRPSSTEMLRRQAATRY